jgi:hypothetical protein
MTKVGKRHNAEFKSKVAVEAIKEQKTINELNTVFMRPKSATGKSNPWLPYQVPLTPIIKTTNKGASENSDHIVR